MSYLAGLMPLVFFIHLDKISERHFQIFTDDLPQESFFRYLHHGEQVQR